MIDQVGSGNSQMSAVVGGPLPQKSVCGFVHNNLK